MTAETRASSETITLVRCRIKAAQQHTCGVWLLLRSKQQKTYVLHAMQYLKYNASRAGILEAAYVSHVGVDMDCHLRQNPFKPGKQRWIVQCPL